MEEGEWGEGEGEEVERERVEGGGVEEGRVGGGRRVGGRGTDFSNCFLHQLQVLPSHDIVPLSSCCLGNHQIELDKLSRKSLLE